MQEDEVLKRRVLDLAHRCDQSGIYTFSGFLGMGEQAAVFGMEQEISFVPWTLFGGAEDCERRMLRFGSEEFLGYDEDFPISCLTVTPAAPKFADALTHRDFLGALMHLGIERDVLGDILVRDNAAYVFCEDSMAEYLAEHLEKVRHTAVRCTVSKKCPAGAGAEFSVMETVVSAARGDAIVAKVYSVSRSQSAQLFASGRVFVNGRQRADAGSLLKPGDVVSVRGHGKFIFDGITQETKKGRVRIRVRRYI